MSAPGLAVDKEAVRMLVLDHGPREAARMCGLKESTVMQWSARGKWLAHTRNVSDLVSGATSPAKQALAESHLPVSMRPIIVSGVSRPAQAKQDRLSRERDATTTAMSALALRTAVTARNVPLRVETPADLLALANAHAKIHRIESGQAAPHLTLNLFAVQTGIEPQTTDI